MRNLSLFFAALCTLVFAACSPKIVYVPVETDTHVEHRDSVIYRTDTLRIDVPVELIKEVVPQLDTLVMETSVAKATAYLDTSMVALRGVLENKKTSLSQVQVVYKEKIQYRDSIQVKEVPVPVEVEKRVPYVPLLFKIMAVIGIIFLAYLTFRVIF